MIFVKPVPLVPLMVQVVETHIDTHTFLETSLKESISLPNNDIKVLEQIFDHIHVSKCVCYKAAQI